MKATYDAAVAGISKAHAGVKAARTERLAKHVEEQAEAVTALDASTAVKRKDVKTGLRGPGLSCQAQARSGPGRP